MDRESDMVLETGAENSACEMNLLDREISLSRRLWAKIKNMRTDIQREQICRSDLQLQRPARHFLRQDGGGKDRESRLGVGVITPLTLINTCYTRIAST